MAGSRLPGPIGYDDSKVYSGDPDLLGGAQLPGPVSNQEMPLQENAGPLNSPSTIAGIELNLVGNFPKPKEWTVEKEKELIAKDSWFPHTDDFLAVAGRGSLIITSEHDFLLKIIEAKQPIGRLNFFTHGVTGYVATSGSIDPKGFFCSLQTGWKQIISTRSIADPYAEIWGNTGENSGSILITVGNKTFTLDKVREKFTKNAEIWLYTCHGGADPMLLQNISNTFQVKVKAFSKIIVYCAPTNFPSNRNHRVNVLIGGKAGDSCSGAVSDFHKLNSDSGASPKKP